MINQDANLNLNHHKVMGDDRGSLVAIESINDIPFEIKRVFYIYGTRPDVSRGQHAHYITKQYLIAVHGSCKITLDDGRRIITHELNQPNIGLFQNAMEWGTMHDFSSDCVLLVLADQFYKEADYIRCYDEFKKHISA